MLTIKPLRLPMSSTNYILITSYTLSISCRSGPGIGNSSELRSLMADIRDVALDTAVDNETTCGASVSLCKACVMSAKSP